MTVTAPRVAVIMPTFDQAAFVPRALESLFGQSLTDWEAVIVDDGSRDETRALLATYAGDPRVRLHRVDHNGGLGAALNTGLALSSAPLVAYLPSDDVWYADHLASLVAALDAEPGAVLAFAGMRHHHNRTIPGQLDGEPLQLVQVVHRRVADRWTERAELTTDDLDRMYWSKLLAHGTTAGTGQVTCEWVDHPMQRHKVMRGPEGGLNPYRLRYGVREPLRFHNTTGHDLDEVERFGRYRVRPDVPLAADGLKILLVGELAYNPERVLALTERGHKLYGLWTDTPNWFNWIGPQPFGHVEDLPADDWQAAVARLRPDVIYGLLNWQAVPFVHKILVENPGIPFVWHFKEGPFICVDKGCWPELLELYVRADGRIYSSAEMRDWFEAIDPRLRDGRPALVLDGDLPKRDLLLAERSPRLSDSDGEIHTVVPGRPIGLHPEDVVAMAQAGIHLHFYGDFIQDMWRAWIVRTRAMAGRFIHIHPTVHQEGWVKEFSQYDAGWLHFFRSENGGELRRVIWDDLNLPARMATLAVSGVPLLQRDNSGHIVATQSIVRDAGLGFFFTDMSELGAQLRDRARLDEVRERVWATRECFTFDYHVDALVATFRAAMAVRAPAARVAA